MSTILASGLQIFYSKRTLERLTHKMALRLSRMGFTVTEGEVIREAKPQLASPDDSAFSSFLHKQKGRRSQQVTVPGSSAPPLKRGA